MSTNIPAMLCAADKIKSRLDDLLPLSVHDSGEHRVAAMLYLTIAEQFAAVLHLINGKFSSHAPIIVRSMLEELVDLLNVVHDPKYVEQMKYDDVRANDILFTEINNVPEIRESDVAQNFLKDEAPSTKKTRTELERQGYRDVKMIERFKKAEIAFEYIGYRELSSYSHSRLTTLLARHADPGFLYLRYHEDEPKESIASTLRISVHILCQAARTLHRYTNLTDSDVKQAIEEADAIWEQAQAS
ncbi:MAG: DUF5677 domain-containing protein [Burkholderiaceae bacterium]|jgi:hypothetical protein|nr:DUF5677 domain-containing protein [Burkholderiaceae bacterium]